MQFAPHVTRSIVCVMRITTMIRSHIPHQRPAAYIDWLIRLVNKEAGAVAEYDRPTPRYKMVRTKEPLNEVMKKFLLDLRP